ncbi:serine hydrolase [Kitasatospora xanthocidica]|uniref:serine hydrolase n=1 Tax=Kitasatospora xanthocidica TaxID=83382 RepID=UPI001678F042|nr:serine hydrolase [Kitasatospora xanthocidica]GHF81949.1 serine hydrolase [Kitasatospora xanthocidica]
MHRRTVARQGRSIAAPLLAGALLAGCTSAATGPEAAPTSPASTAPATAPPQPSPQLTEQQVDSAVDRIDAYVQDAMRTTGVPGLALAVVYKDKVVHAKGFGVRQLGKPDAVTPDTVFQLASVSKPIASTVVAGAVGQKTVKWDDPVTAHDPGFTLADPWVGSHVTIADLFSHRSGLPDHAGDLLEDLGYPRDYILQHLRDQPLAPFRASYAYTNYGLTEAAVAVAKAKGVTWEALAADTLYKPLGMTSTSSLRSAYDSAANKAVPHVRTADGSGWQVSTTNDADPQSPAGGVSSTVQDLARWMRLQLANGGYEGRQVIDKAALGETWIPHSLSNPPSSPAGNPGQYGLGWNVGRDSGGRLRLNHSGAFELGASTVVTLLPAEQLGIVVLTNGQPTGLPEAVGEEFFDLAEVGHESVDWLGFLGKVVPAAALTGVSPTDYTKPPAGAAPAKPDAAYVGTYANGHYGPLTVGTGNGGGLVMTLGPDNRQFPLQPYAGDVFSFQTRGENAVGRSGVTFTVGADGRASKVVVEQLDHDGLGTFTRNG